MKPVYLDMSIGRIIEQWPETREVFVVNGFPELADDDILKQLGLFLKLKTALKSKEIGGDAFIALLEEKIADKRNLRLIESKVIANETDHLNMVSLLPCPLKVPLQRELKEFLEQLREKKGVALNYFVDAYFNNHLNYDDYLEHAEEPDELPDLLFTAGFSLYYRKFIQRFVSRNVFAKAMDRLVNPRLAACGILDPEGHFTVIAVNTLVMVVDKKRLGDLPVPASWSELLKPEYENKVVMRGHDDVFCDIVQLNIFKDHGEDGVRKLARSVKCGWHPSQMVKGLMSRDIEVPPIHIMPYFFYKTIVNCTDVTLVWPEEGILVYPVSLIVKEGKTAELAEVVDFLTGSDVARICANAFFPAAYPDVNLRLPEHVKFKWLGWDFVREHDMETLIYNLNEIFLEVYRHG